MELCGAKTRAGTPCTRVAGWGTEHVGVGRCRSHGGASPNAEAAGAVELARREMVVMGEPLDIEPHEGLIHCIRLAAGHLKYVTDERMKLDSPFVQTMFGPQPNHWITLEQQCMDRLTGYVALAEKLRIDEKRIRAARVEAEPLRDLLGPMLRELGVFDDPRTPEIVARHIEQWERRAMAIDTVAA